MIVQVRKPVFVGIVALAPLVGLVGGLPAAAQAPKVHLAEATIADIHAAFRGGDLTCRQLVQLYLERIQAYDKQGPALNALIAVNPKALEAAEALDTKFRASGLVGPLHCIPAILKDNYNTADMATTGGSAPLAGSIPAADAFTVKRLRAAGAIVLAKANMHELALAGTTVSSLGGQTRNPYSLDRTPGGSSGGTAAAIAVNIGMIGFGSDTVNSIRSPASANSLVGLRPTRGLVSREGVIPVSWTQDAVGPITRSVADAAAVLTVLTGYDPNDPVTAYGVGHATDYTAFLRPNGLEGVRLGVVETLFGTQPIHQPVNVVTRAAIQELRRAGAILVPINVAAIDTDKIVADYDVQKYEYRENLNGYLTTLGPRAPIKTLADLIATGKPDRTIAGFLKTAQEIQSPLDQPDYKTRILRGYQLQQLVMALMADHRLDALVYPHQKRLVVPIGEGQTDRNGILASVTGLPAITVPGGFSPSSAAAPIGVPVGIEFLGRPWSEAALVQIAYAFEQATHYRRPPASAPPLPGEP